MPGLRTCVSPVTVPATTRAGDVKIEDHGVAENRDVGLAACGGRIERGEAAMGFRISDSSPGCHPQWLAVFGGMINLPSASTINFVMRDAPQVKRKETWMASQRPMILMERAPWVNQRCAV